MTLNDLMDELREEYIQSFPKKILDIETFYKAKDLEALTNSFHKLKGSGKTYGVPEMTQLGEYFEILLKAKMTQALIFIPVALKLIHKIHASRILQKEYLLQSDNDFSSLPKP